MNRIEGGDYTPLSDAELDAYTDGQIRRPLTILEYRLLNTIYRDRSETDAMADDVRFAGGNGTSDYWRGYNDGIDKLVERMRESR